LTKPTVRDSPPALHSWGCGASQEWRWRLQGVTKAVYSRRVWKVPPQKVIVL